MRYDSIQIEKNKDKEKGGNNERVGKIEGVMREKYKEECIKDGGRNGERQKSKWGLNDTLLIKKERRESWHVLSVRIFPYLNA